MTTPSRTQARHHATSRPEAAWRIHAAKARDLLDAAAMMDPGGAIALVALA